MRRSAWLLPGLPVTLLGTLPATLLVAAACSHAAPAVAQPAAVIDLGAPPGHSAGAVEGVAGEGVEGEGAAFMAGPVSGEPGAAHALSGASGWEPAAPLDAAGQRGAKAEGMLSPAPEPATLSLLAVMAAMLALRPRRASHRPCADSVVWIRPYPPPPQQPRTSLRTIR